MAASATRLMSGPLSPSLPPTISTPSNHRLDLPHQQVAKGEQQKQQALKSFNVSRREMMCLTAQTLTAATFWPAEPAEARISRSEMKKKLLEKLEQLREKAGFANPNGKDEKNPSPQSPSMKGRLQTSSPPPNPQGDLIRTLAESVFP